MAKDSDPLRKRTTERLEREIDLGRFTDSDDLREAKRILRDHYAEPDRKIQRWILALALGTLVAALLTWFLI